MHHLSLAVLRTARDPLCYPQLVDPLRSVDQSYAQSLADYIKFVVDSPLVDTDDVLSIY